MQDIYLMQKAYKKLMSNIYYDKTSLPLRDKIVSFEFDHKDNLDEYLNNLYTASQEGGNKWNTLSNEIISSISCTVLPKALKPASSCKDVITNFNSSTTIEVEKCQAFIDMSVEGHLMGML